MDRDKFIKKIPVFVFPPNIEFYAASRQSHKQLMTIYNPFDAPVKFKVMCTNTGRYSVTDPEGTILPQNVVDIIIRHQEVTTAPCNAIDKFRIVISDTLTKHILGKRDVTATMLQGSPPTTEEKSEFDHFDSSDSRDSSEYRQDIMSSRNHQAPNWISVVTAIVCISGLMLPTVDESTATKTNTATLPYWLHISNQLKLIFSFVLGLVCMQVLKQ